MEHLVNDLLHCRLQACKLPDLVEILPEARKFGGCYVFGIQSYAQLEDIYAPLR